MRIYFLYKALATFLTCAAFLLTGMSSIRQKRNVNEILDGNLGVGEMCGAGVGGTGITVEDRCNAITKCLCDSNILCKCTLELWFILVIAVIAVLILVGIIYCILRALGCCKR